MDTTNRPESNLPARIPSAGARLPASFQPPAFGGGSASAGGGSSSISPKSLLRGLLRHWWHILGLWILFTLPVLYLIYAVVEPKYEAQAILRVEPTKPSLYSTATGNGDRSFAGDYLQTQLNLISEHNVLEKVATNDDLLKDKDFPLIKDNENWFVDLRKALSVEAIKDTFLIRVSLQSKKKDEAYELVKAVIRSYMDVVKTYAETDNRVLVKSFEEEKKNLTKEIVEAKTRLIALAQKGHITTTKKVVQSDNVGGATREPVTVNEITPDNVTEEQYAKYRQEYIETRMELEAAEAVLVKKKEEEANRSNKTDIAGEEEQKTLAEAELDQKVEAEFLNDPEVRSLSREIDTHQKELARVGRIARKGANEPAIRMIKDEMIELEKQYKELWTTKYESIKRRMMTEDPTLHRSLETESTKDIEQKVDILRARQVALEKALKAMKIENEEARGQAIEAELQKKHIDVLNSRLVQIENHLRQAAFEAGSGNEQVRISIAVEASPPVTPSSDKRIKIMAIAPLVLLGAFVGLFLLLEIRADRVSDPDALSSRVQSEVFALPPLPSAREVRKMRELENGSDQIDRFIQRLDHLRFAVCGSQTPLDNGRCVLVTSAVGGEGKTTLAAQLAARCGNAGMSTLLIDADMRRSSLGTLLDIPDGPGLSDVLKGETTVEEAAIPIQGGTFHLLLAGTPIEDVSRILHGENFGILIARLRELYDLIVIDSPPVLPVPDALILGQWADGAILASRFDISRFPQVERARRQLDIAGITVLGTVINGMRASDSYYGHYSYNRKKGSPPNSPDAN